jgi:hypothetical protein
MLNGILATTSFTTTLRNLAVQVMTYSVSVTILSLLSLQS